MGCSPLPCGPAAPEEASSISLGAMAQGWGLDACRTCGDGFLCLLARMTWQRSPGPRNALTRQPACLSQLPALWRGRTALAEGPPPGDSALCFWAHRPTTAARCSRTLNTWTRPSAPQGRWPSAAPSSRARVAAVRWPAHKSGTGTPRVAPAPPAWCHTRHRGAYGRAGGPAGSCAGWPRATARLLVVVRQPRRAPPWCRAPAKTVTWSTSTTVRPAQAAHAALLLSRHRRGGLPVCVLRLCERLQQHLALRLF